MKKLSSLILTLFLLTCPAFGWWNPFGSKGPKFYKESMLGEKFKEFSDKNGKFESDPRYICQDPPNCNHAYIQQITKGCLTSGTYVEASKDNGSVVRVVRQFGGSCNMYGDLPSIKEYVTEDDTEPKWLKDNGDRTVTAIWLTSGGYSFVTAWCGATPGDYGRTGKVVRRFRDCSTIILAEVNSDTDPEKGLAKSFKVKNFPW